MYFREADVAIAELAAPLRHVCCPLLSDEPQSIGSAVVELVPVFPFRLTADKCPCCCGEQACAVAVEKVRRRRGRDEEHERCRDGERDRTTTL